MSVLRQILGAAAGRGGVGVVRAHSTSTRRASYSSFSGRYFNSARKPPVVAAKNSKAKEIQPTSQDGTDVDTTGDTIADSPSSSSSCTTITTTSSSHCITTTDTTTSTGQQQPNVHLVVEPDFASIHSSAHAHPVITPQELKLHQFFSLHRPLLLINTPPTTLFTPSPSSFTPEPQQPRQLFSVFDDPIDAHAIDADVEAARQLARGLTLNKAGPAVAWEETLKRLGLDPAADPERVELQGQMEREWEDVQILLDSTKRKRRKKMKKHKLKKRRKETRAARLKLK